MNVTILRRRKLGHTSCMSIKQYSTKDVKVLRNDNIPNGFKPDLLVRWGCTSELDSEKTLNKAKAIQLANDKLECRKLFIEKGIQTPKLYSSMLDTQYPCVVRPVNHSQGRHFYHCENIVELTQAINKLTGLGKSFYISEYIPKEREFGVFVFNNRVTSMIEKVPKNEDAKEAYAWNVAQGTHSFENIKWDDWNIPVAKVALKAIQSVGLDFGRVDVIVSSEGIPYVLEVNSAHSLTSEYRQQVFAKCLDYYIEKGSVEKEINWENVASFKSIIHPALRVNAQGLNL
jgi:glutathione synthase/RimK-type ligase-like ATP-grasp enzyme